MRRFAVLALVSVLALPGLAAAQDASAPPYSSPPSYAPPPEDNGPQSYAPPDSGAPPQTYAPPDGGAPDAGAPDAGAPPGKGGHMAKLQAAFQAANVTHDGRLTLAQAQAAGLKPVIKHFSEIDTANRGYVTMNDVEAWHMEQAARKMQQKAAELRAQQ